MEPPYNKKEGLFKRSVAEDIVNILLEEAPEQSVVDAWWWERNRAVETMLASRRPALEDESYLLEMIETNDRLHHLTPEATVYTGFSLEPQYTPR